MENPVASFSDCRVPPRQRGDHENTETVVNLASAVFNSTQEAIVVTDTKGVIIAVNPAFSVITGYAAAEVVGKNMRTLQSGRQCRAFYREIWNRVTATGYWQGEIWNRRKSGDVYPALLTISSVRNTSGRTTHYVGTSTDLSRIKKSELELDHFAHHDELTGLPNRRLLGLKLDKAVAGAMQDGTTGAVVFVDLDRFKLVNDSLGHGAGDELLLLATQRLKATLRADDFLARFGGDEFIVLLERTSRQGASQVASNLIRQLSEPFFLSTGEEIYIGASVGICLFPEDSTSAGQLLQHADAALYQAKASGKSICKFYSSDLTARANTRLSLESLLRRALSRNEFVLHYQPLVRLADRRIVGFEALVRWQDPDRGMIPPSEFLPVAEETGLVVPIGQWVLRSACTQMRAWLKAGYELSSMAVNISARQFNRPDFAQSVSEALRQAGLEASYLELEITEGTLMANDVATVATLNALKAVGVRLAVDDFGTGYSSLAYLKKLPVNKLKIDRSFVTDIGSDPASAAIVSAIISLARCLGLEVLAEGIQNEQQRNALLAAGCTEGQGYLFARPVPSAAVASLDGLAASLPPSVAHARA
jgi:diguanylate cyclase (GGDEF)-like protein/PAS domain S-box-containing protein